MTKSVTKAATTPVTEADIQGHWRRNWLRASGFEDGTTRVHWVQSGPWCADIRVPLIRPPPDAGSLSAMSGADLALLLSAEGFAGRTSLAGDVCTWARQWNWRGFPCPVDAGALWFDDRCRLIEDGIHADYREEWVRVPGPGWNAWAVEAGGMDGMLLANDTGFLLGLGQREAPALPTLAQGLRAGDADPADAAAAFASVYLIGHWDGARGTADLSTQPFCEGRAVLTRNTDSADLTLPDFHGANATCALHLTPLSSS